MKKFFSMLLLAPIAFALVACNESLDATDTRDALANLTPQESGTTSDGNSDDQGNQDDDGAHLGTIVSRKPEVKAVTPEINLGSDSEMQAQQNPLQGVEINRDYVFHHCPAGQQVTQDQQGCEPCDTIITNFDTGEFYFVCSK